MIFMSRPARPKPTIAAESFFSRGRTATTHEQELLHHADVIRRAHSAEESARSQVQAVRDYCAVKNTQFPR